jgi:SNW domain-containing protein 1
MIRELCLSFNAIIFIYFVVVCSYDSRLFNQSSGLDSGFGADDEYSAYSKPLFDRTEASTIYRPKRDDTDVYGDVDTQVSFLS